MTGEPRRHPLGGSGRGGDGIVGFVPGDIPSQTPEPASDWLSLPELADILGEPLGRVRRLLDDRHLIGSRRHGGGVRVPAVFLVDGHPLSSLRGTVFVLHDVGFTDDEAIDWLLAPDDTIGSAPIDALLAGHKSEVRRVARTLA
jgi:hypothetical protein